MSLSVVVPSGASARISDCVSVVSMLEVTSSSAYAAIGRRENAMARESINVKNLFFIRIVLSCLDFDCFPGGWYLYGGWLTHRLHLLPKKLPLFCKRVQLPLPQVIYSLVYSKCLDFSSRCKHFLGSKKKKKRKNIFFAWLLFHSWLSNHFFWGVVKSPVSADLRHKIMRGKVLTPYPSILPLKALQAHLYSLIITSSTMSVYRL